MNCRLYLERIQFPERALRTGPLEMETKKTWTCEDIKDVGSTLYLNESKPLWPGWILFNKSTPPVYGGYYTLPSSKYFVIECPQMRDLRNHKAT